MIYMLEKYDVLWYAKHWFFRIELISNSHFLHAICFNYNISCETQILILKGINYPWFLILCHVVYKNILHLVKKANTFIMNTLKNWKCWLFNLNSFSYLTDDGWGSISEWGVVGNGKSGSSNDGTGKSGVSVGNWGRVKDWGSTEKWSVGISNWGWVVGNWASRQEGWASQDSSGGDGEEGSENNSDL